MDESAHTDQGLPSILEKTIKIHSTKEESKEEEEDER